MTKVMAIACLSLLTGSAVLMVAAPLDPQNPAPPWTASLADIRSVAGMIPGPRPQRINAAKFAESRRTKNFSIKGAPADPSVQARTAFQVVYTDGTVMVDAGMSQQIHNFFGRGVQEPYDAEAFKQVEHSLRSARLIVVTHEHGDHVAGVIHGSQSGNLAPKTMLTRAQVQSLIARPQMPEIQLTEESARRYLVVDYSRYLSPAPGMALISAAGHTPGSQMVYIVLASGREYLLIGDAAWHMDGVRTVTGKDAPWVTEDQNAVMEQLRWLNGLSRTEQNLVIVASHDDEALAGFVQRGILGKQLE